MKAKFNNLSLILENIMIRLKMSKEKWTDGKKNVRMLMPKLKD